MAAASVIVLQGSSPMMSGPRIPKPSLRSLPALAPRIPAPYRGIRSLPALAPRIPSPDRGVGSTAFAPRIQVPERGIGSLQIVSASRLPRTASAPRIPAPCIRSLPALTPRIPSPGVGSSAFAPRIPAPERGIGSLQIVSASLLPGAALAPRIPVPYRGICFLPALALRIPSLDRGVGCGIGSLQIVSASRLPGAASAPISASRMPAGFFTADFRYVSRSGFGISLSRRSSPRLPPPQSMPFHVLGFVLEKLALLLPVWCGLVCAMSYILVREKYGLLLICSVLTSVLVFILQQLGVDLSMLRGLEASITGGGFTVKADFTTESRLLASVGVGMKMSLLFLSFSAFLGICAYFGWHEQAMKLYDQRQEMKRTKKDMQRLKRLQDSEISLQKTQISDFEDCQMIVMEEILGALAGVGD